MFRDVEMRYQENLPLVLNKISCSIRPKEKVGIVGRTGSGRQGIWDGETEEPRPRGHVLRSRVWSCREVVSGRCLVPAGGALRRLHPDRRHRHQRHRIGRSAQQAVHHPTGPGSVQRDGQVELPVLFFSDVSLSVALLLSWVWISPLRLCTGLIRYT